MIEQPIPIDTLIKALLYRAVQWATMQWRIAAFVPGAGFILRTFQKHWLAWQAHITPSIIKQQAESLLMQWEKEDNESIANALAEEAQQQFPEAEIVPMPDAVVPSVMILEKAPEDASDGVKALGSMRITSSLGLTIEQS